jgi:hypothetical protein
MYREGVQMITTFMSLNVPATPGTGGFEALWVGSDLFLRIPKESNRVS